VRLWKPLLPLVLAAGLVAVPAAAASAAPVPAVAASTGARLATTAGSALAGAHVDATRRSVSTARGTSLAALAARPTPVVPVTAPASTAASAMPRGDLPGWRQVFSEDFSTPAALGSFPGRSYSAKWTGYDGFLDTAKRGAYAPGKVLSVHDGALDMFLHTENGRPQVAAPVPLVDGQWNGQTYGRYSVRFRSDPVAGYKTAWLLWPTDDDWNKGEIDFPEGSLNGTMNLFNHCPGDPSRNCFAAGTGTTYTGWHVATVEWTPAGVTYALDGRTLGTSNVSPTHAMRWVLQTETDYGNTPANASGHLLVDWAVMYARTA